MGRRILGIYGDIYAEMGTKFLGGRAAPDVPCLALAIQNEADGTKFADATSLSTRMEIRPTKAANTIFINPLYNQL